MIAEERTGRFESSDDAGSIYDPNYVARLFDEMAPTYGFVNVVSSFGFCVWWRNTCLALASLKPGMNVLDLMSGMGELWPGVAKQLGANASLSAVDLSAEMCRRSQSQRERCANVSIELLNDDVFRVDLPAGSFDSIVCSFGLKTFDLEQQSTLAKLVSRWLKPGGTFSFLEISTPPGVWMRLPYLIYLHGVIPLLGRMFLGNPECYRMLGRYTRRFESAAHFSRCCAAAGLQARLTSHFFGCATSVSGTKAR